MIYNYRESVTQDYVMSHMYFNLAAVSGESKSALGGRNLVAEKMPPPRLKSPGTYPELETKEFEELRIADWWLLSWTMAINLF